MKKREIYLILIVIAIIGLSFISYTHFSKKLNPNKTDTGLKADSQITSSQNPDESYFLSSDDLKATPKNEESPAATKEDQEIDKKIERLPAGIQGSVTRQQAREAMQTQTLLLEEAKKEQVTASDDEVNKFIANGKSQFQISDEEYQNRLLQYGITEQEYKEEVRQQIEIAKLINQSISPKEYAVSDKEVDAFIEQHKEDYQFIYDENDQSLLVYLKSRIKSQMEESKKQALVLRYIKKINSQEVGN